MNILHYALGFPPYRSGGLTKFCCDLMQQQKKEGHKVSLLWPGEMRPWSLEVKVKERKTWQGIGSFEVINPLPVSLDEGIADIEAYTKPCEKEVYRRFLEAYHPDVLHLHTMMGLHRELVQVAKELGVRIVFSVHDFFSICPKVTMFRKGVICPCVADCKECPQCNLTALSQKKIILLQSPLYRRVKDSALVKRLRKNHRNAYLSGQDGAAEGKTAVQTSENYLRLRQYYGSIVSLTDAVHSNSSVTTEAFSSIFPSQNMVQIAITHGDVQDNRKEKEFPEGMLRLTFQGAISAAKGFYVLKEALDELWEHRKDFRLHVFSQPEEVAPYMVVHGRYAYSDLESIYHNTDVAVVPSLWLETFGYTALEALSFGVPVIVSGGVGAKDIIPEGCACILPDMDKQSLKECIAGLTAKKLRQMNKAILEKVEIPTIATMSAQIMSQCYERG